MIRPEIWQNAVRAQEIILGLFTAGLGGWCIYLGGYVLVPVGLVLCTLGAAFALNGLRRLRFAQTSEAPGVVDVLEGEISYLGPQGGGFVGLPDLVEIRLIQMRGRKVWRLKQADGQALLIPVDATGAEKLFDAFTTLQNINMAEIVASLDPAPLQTGTSLPASTLPQMQVLWQKKGAGLVTSP